MTSENVLLALAAVLWLPLAGYLVAKAVLASKRPPAEPLPAPPPAPKQAPSCATCRHFDLAEGQAVMAQYPTFMRVAGVISPAQIARQVVSEHTRTCLLCDGRKRTLLASGQSEACRGCEGTGEILEQTLSSPSAPQKAAWRDCGACMKDGVVVWGGDANKPCWEADA